jgi:hypothetical protein
MVRPRPSGLDEDCDTDENELLNAACYRWINDYA